MRFCNGGLFKMSKGIIFAFKEKIMKQYSLWIDSVWMSILLFVSVLFVFFIFVFFLMMWQENSKTYHEFMQECIQKEKNYKKCLSQWD